MSVQRDLFDDAEPSPEPVTPTIAGWVDQWRALPEVARREALGELVANLDSVGRMAMRNLLQARKRVTGTTRV